MKNSKNLVQAFQIFKVGMTSEWVTILIPELEFNDEVLQKKINWYTYLGYTVKNI
jgi:hypothetical protein